MTTANADASPVSPEPDSPGLDPRGSAGADALEPGPEKRPGWLLREIARLYTYPFVLIAWLLIPPLRPAVRSYLRGSIMVWKVFVEPYRASTQEMAEAAAEDQAPDSKVFIVLITGAICIALLEYFGMSNRFWNISNGLRAIGLEGAAVGLEGWMVDPLHRLTYWAIACVTSYFVIPSIVVVAVFRERLSDYGIGLRGVFKDAWIYVLFFGTVLPALIFVSFDPHFQSMYPFYTPPEGEPLWPRFWTWELLYLLQFFSLEFFFRGFLVHGLRRRLGYYSIFVMMVPYCMIHFGKPFPETLGAIIAGVVLGSLSLKTRSVWMGVAIHASVALTMDFASLWQTGRFGG